ncbi:MULTISPECIES: hypothetical protein [unclassified Streptomyces]|uniref:hypothetical protein n=1 Tax=unclassified Streptomyces TaxID=2593676 RepID=UPI000BF02E0E|nr:MULTISPECIES: hypothetical protein [unclassified Streptomyces]
MTKQPAPEADEPHACKPGATTYYCPTADDTESDCHGGFDVCCSTPRLHQQLIPCSLAYCRQAHQAHSWEPQPGMNPVRCDGYSSDPADARRRHALAFNAVGPVLTKHDRHLPLTVRQEIADAVLAAIDNPH